MMSASAPPKISAMTKSVISRICHQRIFFFFFPFPPLPLLPFFAGLSALLPCAGHRRHRAGACGCRHCRLRRCGAHGLRAAGHPHALRGRGCAAASLQPDATADGAGARGACAQGARGGLSPLKPRGRGLLIQLGGSLPGALPGSGGRFTVRRGRCT